MNPELDYLHKNQSFAQTVHIIQGFSCLLSCQILDCAVAWRRLKVRFERGGWQYDLIITSFDNVGALHTYDICVAAAN